MSKKQKTKDSAKTQKAPRFTSIVVAGEHVQEALFLLNEHIDETRRIVCLLDSYMTEEKMKEQLTFPDGTKRDTRQVINFVFLLEAVRKCSCKKL